MQKLLEKAEIVGNILISDKNEMEEAEYDHEEFQQLQKMVIDEAERT